MLDVLPSLIQGASVGKKVGGSLYVHRASLKELPSALQLYVLTRLCAAEELLLEDDYQSRCESFNVVKFHYTGGVSFLTYPEFDALEHPALQVAVTVSPDLKRASVRMYFNNPPILHRKELFVDAFYPGNARFRELSEVEEAFGLLKNPPGRQDQWDALLKERGFLLRDHKLYALCSL